MTTTAKISKVPKNALATLPEALKILMGFVQNHADKGNDTAIAMVKLAKQALRSHRAIAGKQETIVVLEMSGGLVNVVRANAPATVVMLDQDTEGGDLSQIADIDGDEVYISMHGSNAQEAKKESAGVRKTMAQVERFLQMVPVEFEWLYPDADSNSTPALVDPETGIVKILDEDALSEDYDDVSVDQRLVYEDDLFDVAPTSNGGWQIVKSRRADFAQAVLKAGLEDQGA